MIVGSASYISDDPHPPLHEIYRNNESVSPNPRNPLENYTLYSVDMVDGVLCDTIKFKTDKIFLSHNQVKPLADFTKKLSDIEFSIEVLNFCVSRYFYLCHNIVKILKFQLLFFTDCSTICSFLSGNLPLQKHPGRPVCSTPDHPHLQVCKRKFFL